MIVCFMFYAECQLLYFVFIILHHTECRVHNTMTTGFDYAAPHKAGYKRFYVTSFQIFIGYLFQIQCQANNPSQQIDL